VKKNFKLKISSRKLLLLISVGLSFVVDFIVGMFLAAMGIKDAALLVCPCLLIFVNALYLAFAITSNFRFKYTAVGTALYAAAVIVLAAVCAGVNSSVETVVFSNAACALFTVFHVICAIVILLCGFNAASLGKALRIGAFAFCVVLAAASVGYTVFIGAEGVFGQGEHVGLRTVKYVYDEGTDSYRADALVEGKGYVAVIPSRFNGKPVSSVNCGIFASSGLEEVYLDCGTGVDLYNFADLTYAENTPSVFVAKDTIDLVRKEFFDKARQYATGAMTETSSAVLKLANSFAPSGLEEDEVFVACAYTLEQLELADDEIIPVWIGKKGGAFDLSNSGIDYAENSDVSNFSDMYWNYNNNSTKILSHIRAKDGKDLKNAKITESAVGASLVFDNIYRIAVGSDNDSVYEVSDDFKYSRLSSGQTYNYRLVTEETADSLLAEMPARKGFDLSWKYGSTSGPSFSSLSYVVKNFGSVTIHPIWEMKAPTVEIKREVVSTISGLTNPVYGDTVNLKAQYSHELANLSAEYIWSGANNHVGMADTLSMNKVEISDSGKYTVKVVVSDPSITSCSAAAEISVNLQIKKRPLPLIWAELDNPVYNAADKTVNVTYDEKNVISGDTISLTLSNSTLKDAGEYLVGTALSGDCADKYDISATATHNYVVEPFGISLDWGTKFNATYDGKRHTLNPTVTPLAGDTIPLSVNSCGTYAGNYTISASTTNSNYTLLNPTHIFIIDKKPLKITALAVDRPYQGTDIGANLNSYYNYDGLVSGESIGNFATIELRADNARDVGTYEIKVKVTKKSDGFDNYTITTDSGALTIHAVSLTVSPKSVEIEYSGRNYTAFEAQAQGLKGSDKLSDVAKFNFSVDDALNAGTHQVTISVAEEGKLYKNYNPITFEEGTLTITTAQLKIFADSKTKVYDGKNTEFTFTTTGLKGSDTLSEVIEFSIGATDAINVGTRDITFSETKTKAKFDNYAIEMRAGTLNITPAPLTIKADDKSKVYDHLSFKNFTFTADGLKGDDKIEEVAVITLNAKETMDAGSHTITVSVLERKEKYGNYDVKLENGTLTIEQRTITFTWKDKGVDFVYDGKQHSPEVLYNSSSAPYMCKYLDSEGRAFDEAPTEVGSYTVVVFFSNNYKCTDGSDTVDFEIIAPPDQQPENGGETL